eukprot:756662-Hanusia_phi.AAC.3
MMLRTAIESKSSPHHPSNVHITPLHSQRTRPPRAYLESRIEALCSPKDLKQSPECHIHARSSAEEYNSFSSLLEKLSLLSGRLSLLSGTLM